MGEAAKNLGENGQEPGRAGCAVWFTGLPGSGKSAIAQAVRDALAAAGLPSVLLSMDERRGRYSAHPGYTGEEREAAYRAFADEAAGLTRTGNIVLMDATAYKLAMRRYAREKIERFAEVYVRCPLAAAMRREAARPDGLVMAGLYAKAVRRKTTGAPVPGLGEVVGVDVPFEENPAAECRVDSERLSISEARDLVLARFANWFGK
ncbi:MAG: adenylyl-sulfate kinase [Desulfovibrionaceae bacterium]|nr:adenylyl-sulfate kinase [Desulfovibrionaceae bacterium]MBF0513302.1 adenylyl-sulfate kinase [Desulfovibrionaceae bacterium]